MWVVILININILVSLLLTLVQPSANPVHYSNYSIHCMATKQVKFKGFFNTSMQKKNDLTKGEPCWCLFNIWNGIFFIFFRRFVYHFWSEWCSDVTSLETLRDLSSSSSIRDNSTSETWNKTSRRYSPSIIPSLFELASSSFKLLRELNSGLNSRTSVTEEFEDEKLLPLSTPSEVRFCKSVIAGCQGADGEIQKRCASNYRQWIMLRSKCSTGDCNGVMSNTGEIAMGS